MYLAFWFGGALAFEGKPYFFVGAMLLALILWATRSLIHKRNKKRFDDAVAWEIVKRDADLVRDLRSQGDR